MPSTQVRGFPCCKLPNMGPFEFTSNKDYGISSGVFSSCSFQSPLSFCGKNYIISSYFCQNLSIVLIHFYKKCTLFSLTFSWKSLSIFSRGLIKAFQAWYTAVILGFYFLHLLSWFHQLVFESCDLSFCIFFSKVPIKWLFQKPELESKYLNSV